MEQPTEIEIKEVLEEAATKLGNDSRFVAGLTDLIKTEGVEVAKKYLECTDQSALYEWSKYIGLSSIPGAPKDYTFVQYALQTIEDSKRTPFMFIPPGNVKR